MCDNFMEWTQDMSDYTPTTHKVRYGYSMDIKYGDTAWEAERLAEFDRWLAAHDMEVRAKAYDDMLNFLKVIENGIRAGIDV